MKLSTIATFLSFTGLVAAGRESTCQPQSHNSTCYTPKPIPKYNGSDFVNIGMVLFPAYDLIDVYGTLEALWLLSMGKQKMNLYLIAETMEPVGSGLSPGMNRMNSSFSPKLLPNNTFDNLDVPLDILFVPGGPGTLNPNTTVIERFLQAQVPEVKIFASICTGATIAARAGIFDGQVATTNKGSWARITGQGPKAHWVAPARYVRDGKFWSASGVTSGIDLVLAFVKSYWGEEEAAGIARSIEHVPASALDDPFTKLNNITGAAQLCPGYSD